MASLLSSVHTTSSIERDPRWLALSERDARADGTFFYSVRTTGVYCRPSCAARTPRPENVAFHPTSAEAERAGFRACKRCRPTEASLADRDAALVASMCRLLEESTVPPPSLDALAAHVGLSKFHAHRLFKAVAGVTPRAYARARRASRVRESLEASVPVTRAIYDAGFASSGNFYADSSARLGMTPSQYRAGGASRTIHHATGPCTLGRVLVAWTDRGVAAMLLGDDDGELERDLAERFPHAARVRAESAEWLAEAIGIADSTQSVERLPLDIRGTAFQQRVWEELRRTGVGDTVSYTELASRVGAPKAVRAVASACASNPVAIAVPCHRVVRKDGALAGYRWGIARKRTLLDREATIRLRSRR